MEGITFSTRLLLVAWTEEDQARFEFKQTMGGDVTIGQSRLPTLLLCMHEFIEQARDVTTHIGNRKKRSDQRRRILFVPLDPICKAHVTLELREEKDLYPFYLADKMNQIALLRCNTLIQRVQSSLKLPNYFFFKLWCFTISCLFLANPMWLLC